MSCFIHPRSPLRFLHSSNCGIFRIGILSHGEQDIFYFRKEGPRRAIVGVAIAFEEDSAFITAGMYDFQMPRKDIIIVDEVVVWKTTSVHRHESVAGELLYVEA
jgi:hypothetical protein